MSVVINSEPVEIVIDGTSVMFQGDPMPSPEWDTLMETEWSYSTAEGREKAKTDLTEALAALTASDGDAETFRKLDAGVTTLRKISYGYVEAVTGFPTKPSPGSKKR